MLDRNGVLNQSYFDLRCMLLEIAATLDRLDRAGPRCGPAMPDDPRLTLLRQAINVVALPTEAADRAERMLLMFSEAPTTR